MSPLVISGHDITVAVCDALDITPRDLNESRRSRVVTARHMVWYIYRQMTAMSYPEIGRYFGKDHSTIIHGVQVFSERISRDQDLNNKTMTIMAYLREEKSKWQMTSSGKSTTSSARRPA
jgi:chromosomal replication initiator protein